MVSWVSVGLLFLWIFDADAGVVNRSLGALGISPIKWLTSTTMAPLTVALIVIWKVTGYAMVVFLSGLSALPPEVKEAAALDGAGPWARLRHVTLPLLRPTATFVATTSLIASFQLFDVVRLLTQGGPGNASKILPVLAYQVGIQAGNLGRGAAIALFLVPLLFPALFLVLRNIKRREW